MEADDDEEDRPVGANPLEPKATAAPKVGTGALGDTSVTSRPGMQAGDVAVKGLTMPIYKKPKQVGKPPPPSKNKQNWDMTQDFLKQHGLDLRGRKITDPEERPPPEGAIHPMKSDRPMYPGTFVGQVQDTSKVVPKNVAWKDKNDPDKMRYGKVQGKGVHRFVWDGKTWVSPEEFEAKFGKKAESAMRESLVVSMLAENSWRTSDDYLADNPETPVKWAEKILQKHGLSMEEFYNEFPMNRGQKMLDTKELLDFMGY